MKNILKGLFIIISVICIAFSAFFVYSYATGHTGLIGKVERGLMIAGLGTGIAGSGAGGSSSTISMLTDGFGLTTSQAGQVIALADQLGIDTTDGAEMGAVVARNIGNADEIQGIAEAYQSGDISEAQAKALLKDVINV